MLEYMRVKRHDLNPTLPARRQLFDVQRRLEARYAGDERIVTRLTNASWALPSAKPTSRSNGSGSACVVSDGSGVTTTNNDISANNDSIRVEGSKGVQASLRKLETLFDGATALEVMTIMNTHVNSLQPRDLPKPRRQRKTNKLSWIDSRHAGGSKKRPAPTRSPHTGKPTPIRPPGESYRETKPGEGWIDTMTQGRNHYQQHQGGNFGRMRGGGMRQNMGPGSVSNGIFQGKPRRSVLKSAISRQYDRVMVAVARNSAREAEALEVNKLTAAVTSAVGGHASTRGSRSNSVAEDSIASAGTVEDTPTAATTEPIAIGAPSSVTKEGDGSLTSPSNSGVQWRTDSLPPSMESEQSKKQKKLAGSEADGGADGKPTLDLQAQRQPLSASLTAADNQDESMVKYATETLPTSSSSAVDWHGSDSWGGNAMAEPNPSKNVSSQSLKTNV
eukprot:g2450.t1